jgi:hypothetical protein
MKADAGSFNPPHPVPNGQKYLSCTSQVLYSICIKTTEINLLQIKGPKNRHVFKTKQIKHK